MKYKHDCPACVPLGEFYEHDLYFCTGNHGVYHGQVVIVVRTSQTECFAISIQTMRFYLDLAKQAQHDTNTLKNSTEELLCKYSRFSLSEIEAFIRYNKRPTHENQ